MLTGKVCHLNQTDVVELVHCHIAKAPVPVCEANPNVPEDSVRHRHQTDWRKMLEERYQSAIRYSKPIYRICWKKQSRD
jgi:hypothetical protein